MRSLRRSTKASLSPDYDADFILVDRDLYKAPATAILQTQVKATYVNGKEVYPPAQGSDAAQ